MGRALADACLGIIEAHRRDDPAPGDCPSWCELAQGHGYISSDLETGQDVRTHSYGLGQHVDLIVKERVGEPLFSQPVRLWVSVDADAMDAAARGMTGRHSTRRVSKFAPTTNA